MANPSPVSSLILPAEQQSLQGTNLKKKKKLHETKGNQKQIIFQIIALQSCWDIAHFSQQTKTFSWGSI